MKYYIGADLGTSALKLLLVDSCGKIVKMVTRSYLVQYPRPAWSEQNPEDWWAAFISGVKELMNETDPSQIKGIGVGGQMHGLVVLDENDNVIRPAILWNDSRADKETAYLNEVIGKEKLSQLTANIAFAGFTAPKILWLKNNEPENFEKIRKIMLPKDYINYKLTGVHCTDYSDASGTLLLDVKNKCWSKEMLNICSVSKRQMPKLFESYETVAMLLPEIAMELRLHDMVKVVAGAGDNAAAAIGTGTVGNGKCNISLGTSGTVFVSSDTFVADKQNALHSFCHAGGNHHLMACILSAASCNKWFCENILKTDNYEGEQSTINQDLLGKNDVYFLPYLMGERSTINDTDARGMFIVLRMDTTRADMVQAVLEGVAFAIRDSVEIARGQGVPIAVSTLCGGGAKSPLWQTILCNVLNIEIAIPKTEQGPGYGAAMLAMVAAGEWENIASCAQSLVEIKCTVTPQNDLVDRYEERYKKFKEIYPTVKELYKKLK